MIVVIGGSLGGCEALQRILQRLPPSFAAPIVVALHRHKDSGDILAPVVQKSTAMPVTEADDRMPLEAGHVYLAPPDYQLMFEGDTVALSTDDLVNWARPSIDVLFEAAAEWKGSAVIAVVLTGASSDGAAGAKRVVESGGTVVIQDPTTAEGSWMPLAAIEATRSPHVMNLEQIAEFLIKRSTAN